MFLIFLSLHQRIFLFFSSCFIALCQTFLHLLPHNIYNITSSADPKISQLDLVWKAFFSDQCHVYVLKEIRSGPHNQHIMSSLLKIVLSSHFPANLQELSDAVTSVWTKPKSLLSNFVNLRDNKLNQRRSRGSEPVLAGCSWWSE